MPGALVRTPDVVIAIDDGEKFTLTGELYSIDRPGVPFDAVGAAELLQTPSAQPVEFDDRQAHAVLRALDNLRYGNRLAGGSELLRIRDALLGLFPLPSASYELELPGSTGLVGWTSYSGPREIGDRLCTTEGDWRIEGREDQPSGVVKLICGPFMPPPE